MIVKVIDVINFFINLKNEKVFEKHKYFYMYCVDILLKKIFHKKNYYRNRL